ncbi:MAG: type II secretion system F family protein [Candidatus Omnitrophica bacterium]|nr:type II secretion system F family protein [Candidatus Omnitrophota bacterium]
MQFDYSAIDKTQAELQGQIDAPSLNEAIAKLGKMGLFVLEVTPAGQRPSKRIALWHAAQALRRGMNRVPRLAPADLVIFTRQLSVLIDAGLPLVKGLETLQRQVRFIGIQSMIADIVAMIESGETLSGALGHYPKSFTKVYINIVRAGETGGALDVVLRQLADFQEKNLKLFQRIRSALIYPCLVLFVSVGILFFMITFVIPKFTAIFDSTGVKLPALTAFMVGLSAFVRHYWYVGIVAGGGLVAAYHAARRSIRFRFIRDRFLLQIPILGDFLQKIVAARFSRTLATLLGGGVAILRALDLSKDVVDNEVVCQAVTRVYDHVREGGFIAQVLQETNVFPQLMVDMISVGEESGAVEKMLLKIADAYEDEVELTANTLAALLEPILVIGMGVVTGVIVLSLFLPMISLIESLS